MQKDEVAGIWRRLGAMISDALVVTGLLLLTTLVVVVPLLHLAHKQVIAMDEVGVLGVTSYWLMMLAVWSAYFVMLWHRSGQTVGMRAWRLRVTNAGGGALTFRQAMIRFAWAIALWLPSYAVLLLAEWGALDALRYVGLGLLVLPLLNCLWMCLDNQKRTWHDIRANSEIKLLPKL